MNYELYAVVVHEGFNAEHGHYYVFAKDDGQWYKFNDSHVTKWDLSDIHEMKTPATPYILFYR